MTPAAADWSHVQPGVSLLQRGRFELQRSASGQYLALVTIGTELGHVSAHVPLDPRLGQWLQSAAASNPTASGQVPAAATAPVLTDVAARIDAAAARLSEAAAARGTHPGVLRAAQFIVRAHVGDDRARASLQRLRQAARAGDPNAQKRLHWLRVGRDFAREVLSDTTLTGASFFHDLGNSLHRAAVDASHAVRDAGRDVRAVAHALGPVVKTIKRWGPMILSDVQGMVSMIPGIGTGISAAIAAGEAVLSGGLKHPLEFAIHIAYGAIPIPPGIRPICDTVLDTVLALIRHPHNLLDAALAVARDRIPAGLPREIFDTLIKIVAKKRPITHAAADLAGHYVTQMTQGLGPSLQAALPKLPPEVQAHLSRLPDPSVTFDSIHTIAPHFTLAPGSVPQVLAHAVAATGAVLSPDETERTARAMRLASAAHAQAQASLRLAQHAHDHPTEGAPDQGASLSVELSPDATQQRLRASASLSSYVQQGAPS